VDALALAFEDAAFDFVCRQFGAIFFPDRISATAKQGEPSGAFSRVAIETGAEQSRASTEEAQENWKLQPTTSPSRSRVDMAATRLPPKFSSRGCCLRMTSLDGTVGAREAKDRGRENSARNFLEKIRNPAISFLLAAQNRTFTAHQR
jgi:hypothetical protein